jgi:hypothetical protein
MFSLIQHLRLLACALAIVATPWARAKECRLLPPFLCFPAETLATRAVSTQATMDQFKQYDDLLSYDEEKKAFVSAKINQIFVHDYEGDFAEITLTDGSKLKPTAEHPFRNLWSFHMR